MNYVKAGNIEVRIDCDMRQLDEAMAKLDQLIAKVEQANALGVLPVGMLTVGLVDRAAGTCLSRRDLIRFGWMRGR